MQVSIFTVRQNPQIRARMRHPAAVKSRCLSLIDSGRTPAELSLATGVRTDTIYDWVRRRSPQKRLQGEQSVKGKGSGVIAPPAYARGYRVGWGKI